MRTLIFILGLAAAPAAHADVSDSGNLSIGGSGVIAGTMTVQGNAFNVGGATFSVAGGSITLGGRLNTAVAGIKWADGSTSTTAAVGGISPLPTRQVFTSTGSGVYYSTASTGAAPRQLRIRMIGGGGGGSCGYPGGGDNGGASSFASVVASSGIGGAYSGSGGGGGSGGTGGTGSASLRIAGGRGQDVFDNSAVLDDGGMGGNGVFGGAGTGGPHGGIGGKAAAVNSGGGGGGCSDAEPGAGGGAGEYAEMIINAPAATYPYVVGAAGIGKAAGTNGGNGGSGMIIVDELY